MLKSDQDLLRRLLVEMRSAYSHGENAMACARKILRRAGNDPVSTLVAYDLQSGSYIESARQDPESNIRWYRQVAELIKGVLPSPMDISIDLHRGTLLEVGCGEATTLAGVVKILGTDKIQAYGFDLCWSRVAAGNDWLKENAENASLFVADLFHIPLADDSIDVVYTAHSLEPNRYREAAALRECLRVARRAVVIVEPIYELASEPARRRMDKHRYVKGLKKAVEGLDAEVLDYRLLEYCTNPLNPSGVLLLGKRPKKDEWAENIKWICPLTGAPLTDHGDLWFAREVGIAYPLLRGIPCGLNMPS